MDYDKKVLVLKQVNGGFSSCAKPVSAIARVESENGVSDFHISIINLAPVSDAEYRAYFCDSEKRIFEFNLGVRPLSFNLQFPVCPSLEGGFAVGVYFIKDYLPTPVCLGFSQGFGIDKTSLNKMVAEKCLNSFKSPQKEYLKVCEQHTFDKEIDSHAIPSISVPPILSTPPQYDDEAVATENYYEKDQIELTDKEILQEFNRERLSYKNEFIDYASQEKTRESTQGFARCENEAFASRFQSDKQQNYYSTVKDEHEDIFNKFESESYLCSLFPSSKWAKINYAKDKFYVVGLVVEKGAPKYVCYGVPDDNPTTPPEQLKGYCSLVKLFPNTQNKRGYWMMFQDAQNGKCIHVEN